MAAVTQTSTAVRHIVGDLALRVYTFTGSSGDTLIVPLKQILHIGLSAGSLITAITQTPLSNGNTQLTFTSSAPMTGENIMILSRVG